jgi:hypothetical protein
MSRKWWAALLLVVWGPFLPALASGEEAAVQKFHLEVYADFDYDFNATQQPDSQPAKALVPRRGSMVFNQYLKGEYNINPEGRFDIQAKYELFQNFHNREFVGYLDTMTHNWTLRPSYNFLEYQNLVLWVPFAFNYTDVGSDKYTTTFSLTPNIFHRLSEAWGYSLEMRLIRNYGWVPQYFPQFYDYTARALGGSAGLYYFHGNTGGYLQLRLSYDYVGSRGSNNDASSYNLTMSGEYPVLPDLRIYCFLSLGLLPYDHPYYDGTFFPYPKRLDKTLLLGSTLTYDIYKGLYANLHYYLRRQDSNIGLYDYVTHIIGVQVGYHY